MISCTVLLASVAALPATTTIRGKPGAARVSMPAVAMGNAGSCYPDPTGHEATDPNCPAYAVIKNALDVGYRSFHDALSYGNQAGLGAALKDALAEPSATLQRSDLFVMSMVYVFHNATRMARVVRPARRQTTQPALYACFLTPPHALAFSPKYLMGTNATNAAVSASLAQLQVEYIDLVMVHHRAADNSEWPRSVSTSTHFPANWLAPGNPTLNGTTSLWTAPPCALADPTWVTGQDETWAALVALRDAGTIRAIGVSNWQVANLERMKALKMELPAVNQIEQHIGWHDDAMLEWCASNDIVVQAATPLARSLPSLVEPGVEPVISGIATKYGKSVAQVALRFLVEKGVSPLPSAHSTAYQKENLDLFDFALTDAEVRALGLVTNVCRGEACDGLAKCWADPGTMMCRDDQGRAFHCP